MIVEVCANSLQSAINAEQGGADRIELCSELAVGGVTPSYGLLKAVKNNVSVPVHVLIRPRSGDFTYSEREFAIMKEDISCCRELGFAGIVSGVLYKDFTLDAERTSELSELGGDMKFTFHRAFDWVKAPLQVFDQLTDLKVDYILSSGQKPSAIEGMPLLKELQKKSTRCKIIPGGGIHEANAHQFLAMNFEIIHLSGTDFHQSLAAKPTLSMNNASFMREDQIYITSVERLEKIIKIVK